MVLPIKPICRSNKLRKDGTSLIFFQYCYSATKRTLLNTEIAIPVEYWAKKLRCISHKLPAQFGDHQHLNEELKRQFRIVEDQVTHANKNELTNKGIFVKNTFSPKLDITTISGQVEKAVEQEIVEKRARLDIYYQYDEYIKSKERKVSKATLTVYGNVKSHLLAFEAYRKQKITFDSFDFGFYEDFVDYLTF